MCRKEVKMGDSIFKKVGIGMVIALLGVLVIGVFALLFALPVMWLWNWLMPAIFGLPTIGFLQTLGLLILSGLLVKGSSVSSK